MSDQEHKNKKDQLFAEVWHENRHDQPDQKDKEKTEINFLRFKHKFDAHIYYLRRKKVPQQMAIFLILAIFALVVFESAGILARGVTAKSEVLSATTAGLAHLQEAEALAKQSDFVSAQAQFALAEQNFIKGKIDLNSVGSFFSGIVNLSSKGKSANAVLDAGSEIADAGTNLNSFYGIVSEIKTSPAGLDAPDGFYATMNVAKKYLEISNSDLTLASANLAAVDPKDLPVSYQQQFSGYVEQIQTYNQAISQMSSLLSLVQNFIGPGQKSILVLFENDNELRASGGFVGTYGFFKLNNGKIINEKISSIYDLDGQLQQKIAPPGPFHDLTDSWALRDSNWFVDFKQSAQKASDFYEKEGGETPDAVIAVTPDIFIDLLSITGPINFPKYGFTLNASNFREFIQLNSSDKQNTQPKQILADFAPLLLQDLFAEGKKDYGNIATVIFSNLAQKNLLFYDRDINLEKSFEDYNWAGAIADTDRDYLAVYDSNLGGQKTSLNITQNIKLQSAAQSDGTIINTLTYTRSHADIYTDPKNISYLRFLVPSGSELISAQGFTNKPYYKSDGSGHPFEPTSVFKVDPDLQTIDAATHFDSASGTTVTNEAGKTEFANWIDLQPGQTATAVIKYRLPFNISQTKKYSFLMQKQPGSLPISVNYELKSGQKYSWYSRYDLNVQGDSITLNQDLKEDLFVGLVFDK